MAGAGRKWLVGCGVGCAVAALLAIIVTVGGGILLTRPFNRAVSSQTELTAVHGERDEFVPATTTFERDRIKAFVIVRKELLPICAKFEEIAAKFQAVEELDEDGDDVSAGEAMKTVLPVVGAAMGIAGNIGRHSEARNQALLAQDMGLGEYIWYYVLIYNSWLGYPANQDFDDGESSGGYSPGERRVISALLANHAEGLREAGAAAEADLWQAEAGAVLESETGVPFGPGGLPDRYAALLEPARGKLEAMYCAATSSFELGSIRKKGLSFRSD